MTAENSLLLKSLKEIMELLLDERLASLIKSKDLEETVVSFCNLVEAYSASQGQDALSDGSKETIEKILQDINKHLATFSDYNLIELKKLDFVENIKPRP